MADSFDPIQTRELSTNKFIVGTNQTPITTQSTISDYTASTTLTDPPTKTEVEAELALIATAINTILVRLKDFGLIA